MSTVLITGGSGLVGQRLSILLGEKGFKVIHLSRKENLTARFPAYRWDLAEAYIDETALAQADYIIHLAGAGIADKAWTKSRRQEILKSRVNSSDLLFQYLKVGNYQPKAFVSASGVGYYPHDLQKTFTEENHPAKDFLGDTCKQWEASVQQMERLGIRTVKLRLGIVLSTQGGALAKSLPFYPFGIAPYFGNGRQWYPWVHIDDVCRLFIHAIEQPQMAGAYNAVSPNPLTNKQLAHAIAQARGRRALLLPAPALLLRLMLGKRAEIVLRSCRPSAEKAVQNGYVFQHPEAVEALRDVLKRRV